MLNVSLTEVWENGNTTHSEHHGDTDPAFGSQRSSSNPSNITKWTQGQSSVFLKRLPCNNLSTPPVPDLANGSWMTSANPNPLSRNLEMIRKVPACPYATMLKPGRAGRRRNARAQHAGQGKSLCPADHNLSWTKTHECCCCFLSLCNICYAGRWKGAAEDKAASN